jgi:hypothetical protein
MTATLHKSDFINRKQQTKPTQQTKPAYMSPLWHLWAHQPTLSSDPKSEASNQEARAKDK